MALTPFPAAQNRLNEAKRNRSLGVALAKIDAKTVTAWVNRWTSSEATAPQNGPKLVRIDTEVLARRHPAWLLADAVERGTIEPTAPQIGRVLNVAMASGNASTSGQNAALDAENAFSAVRIQPAVTLREKTEFAGAAVRQSAALEGFFRSVASRDAVRGRDEAILSRRALEDSIATAQRGAVPELDLSLLPPEITLELTNLRLQLLRNLSKTPAQRAAAREEIRIIEARYAQILREETARQAAKLRQARIETPRQNRSAGLEKIAREIELEAQNRAGSRRSLALEAQNRVRVDFDSNSTLNLALPSSRALSRAGFNSPGFDPAGVSARSNLPDAQFFETAASGAASQAPIPNGRELAASKKPARSVVAALRGRARKEAGEWAQLVAGNLGATWSASPNAPDATQEALEKLFPVAK